MEWDFQFSLTSLFHDGGHGVTSCQKVLPSDEYIHSVHWQCAVGIPNLSLFAQTWVLGLENDQTRVRGLV